MDGDSAGKAQARFILKTIQANIESLRNIGAKWNTVVAKGAQAFGAALLRCQGALLIHVTASFITLSTTIQES